MYCTQIDWPLMAACGGSKGLRGGLGGLWVAGMASGIAGSDILVMGC